MLKLNPIRSRFKIKAGQYTIDVGERTRLMGVINMTPDSFSGDGCLTKSLPNNKKALRLAQKLILDGANILDVGGESTRPGADPISAEEEIKRVIPFLRSLSRRYKIPISIDTYKPEVAQAALDEGATIVNIIMGTHPDRELLKMVRDYHAAVVLMHIRGNPKTMQKNVRYKDPVKEIGKTLKISIEKCLEIGIKSDRIIIDPGIGFGKSVIHNLEIIERLDELRSLHKPILIGPSRKSFIGKILGRPVEQRLLGTLASVSASVLHGAHIVRVHDVAPVKETIRMVDAILNPSSISTT